jgi:hypothetical protein
MQTTVNKPLNKFTKQQLLAHIDALEAKVENQPILPAVPVESPFKYRVTIAMGIAIPLLSLTLSKMGGTLLNTNLILAMMAFGLMTAVLAVSLPHLAWSISDITRSDRRSAWCLAVALDLSLVLCELVGVYASEAGLGGYATVMLFSVVAGSAVLNCWAFLKSHTTAK